jgi:hypothetical protein
MTRGSNPPEREKRRLFVRGYSLNLDMDLLNVASTRNYSNPRVCEHMRRTQKGASMAIGALGQSFDHEDPDIRTVGRERPRASQASPGATLHRLCESLVPTFKRAKECTPILWSTGQGGEVTPNACLTALYQWPFV